MDHPAAAGPIALVTATRREMQAVLGERGQSVPLRFNVPQEILWEDKPLVLLITGIGPVNAAMALGGLAAMLPRLAGVLNMGIAGCFDPNVLPLGAVVGVHTEIWPEFGLHTEQGLEPDGLGLGQGRVHGRVVWDTLPLQPELGAARMGLKLDPRWPWVTSLSVAGVSGTPQRALQLRMRYRAELENMEGFALGWVCALRDLPFVQIRSISNRVGSRSTSAPRPRNAIRATLSRRT